MGCALAQQDYAMAAFGEEDALRWQWLGKAAARGVGAKVFMFKVVQCVRAYEKNRPDSAPILYELGKALQHYRYKPSRTMFFHLWELEQEKSAEWAAKFYYDQTDRRMRQTVESWLIVATRMGVSKDIRFCIGKWMYRLRPYTEFEYAENLLHNRRCIIS